MSGSEDENPNFVLDKERSHRLQKKLENIVDDEYLPKCRMRIDSVSRKKGDIIYIMGLLRDQHMYSNCHNCYCSCCIVQIFYCLILARKDGEALRPVVCAVPQG